jgi:hypothetical protein
MLTESNMSKPTVFGFTAIVPFTALNEVEVLNTCKGSLDKLNGSAAFTKAFLSMS